MTGAELEHRFPCNACGADLRFEPGAGAMVCDNCGAIEPLRADIAAQRRAVTEQDFETALAKLADTAPEAETRVIRCENCGAEIELSEEQQATECPFCASPVVLGTGR